MKYFLAILCIAFSLFYSSCTKEYPTIKVKSVQVTKEQCTVTHRDNVIEIANETDLDILFVIDVIYMDGDREYEIAYSIKKETTGAIRVKKDIKSVKVFFCISLTKCFTIDTGQ